MGMLQHTSVLHPPPVTRKIKTCADFKMGSKSNVWPRPVGLVLIGSINTFSFAVRCLEQVSAYLKTFQQFWPSAPWLSFRLVFENRLEFCWSRSCWWDSFWVDIPFHLPADTIGVFAIVPLRAVVYVVKHNNTGYEVHCLARRKEVQVGPAIPSPVTISGITGSRWHSC